MLKIFKKLDGQGGKQIADSMTSLSNKFYTIALVNNINRLTEMAVQQNTQVKRATISGGKITIKDD